MRKPDYIKFFRFLSDFRRIRKASGLWITLILLFYLPLPAQSDHSGLASSVQSDMSGGYDWMQFNFDSRHSGNDTSETTITRKNVSSLHRIFHIKLPDVADGAPVYLSAAKTSKGVRDVLFVSTKTGLLYAYDARSGESIWEPAYQTPNDCRINNGSEPCYTTSSPAIDPGKEFIYRYGLDGKVHKHRVSDGNEVTGGGWPQTATIKPRDEKGSSALSIATAHDGTSYLYVTNSGYLGDRGDYQGHVTAVNLATGEQKVFNANCSNRAVHFGYAPRQPDCPAVRSGIWARPGTVYDPVTDRIYLATGNGPYDPAKYDWGDTVFSLRPDGTGRDGKPLDNYTPENYRGLREFDLDLGSTAPAVIPVPATGSYKSLGIQCGKDSKVRLLNLENLNGHGEPGFTGGALEIIDLPQGGMVLTQPAVWRDSEDNSAWTFIANSRGISAFKLPQTRATPKLRLMWKNDAGGTSPIIANDVLFYVAGHTIRALDPVNGKELWSDTGIGAIHWQSPIVVNGVLYITDQNSDLSAFAPEIKE